MKLFCADLLNALRNRPILMLGVTEGAIELPVSQKGRRDAVLPLVAKIHKAEKYIFDSGSDQDRETVKLVRKIALDMLKAGLFHLPHPSIWIEDPFEEAPDRMRHFYLCEENENDIRIHSFLKIDHGGMAELIKGRLPDYAMTSTQVSIDLVDPSDMFNTWGHTEMPSAEYTKKLGEVVYAVKKFIVTLNTTYTEMERVKQKDARAWKGDPRGRPYDHTVIRIPFDTAPGDGSSSRTGTGKRPRRHLVDGYIAGKNTRPIEKQKNVKPYWRGSREIGTIDRSHSVVPSRPIKAQ